MPDYVRNGLANLKIKEDIETICNYIIAMNTEVNPSLMHKKNNIIILCYLLEFYYNKNKISDNNNKDICSKNNHPLKYLSK
jgi:hypothetical protein